MSSTPDSHLERILSEYTNELAKDKNIIGAVLTGSAGRGDMDIYSDVDIVVFVKKKNSKVREGKFDYQSKPFDVRVSEFLRLEKTTWTPDENFAYLNSKIIYDPQNQLRNMIIGKKHEWAADVYKRVILSFVQLSVIVEFEDNWKGLRADTHFRKFISRMDYVSAHRTLNLGFEFLLDLFFLIKNEPIPDYKNKLRVFEKVALPSVETLTLIKAFAQIGNSNLVDAEKKYEILCQLRDYIKSSTILKNAIFPDNFYKFYLENRT